MGEEEEEKRARAWRSACARTSGRLSPVHSGSGGMRDDRGSPTSQVMGVPTSRAPRRKARQTTENANEKSICFFVHAFVYLHVYSSCMHFYRSFFLASVSTSSSFCVRCRL